MRTATVQISTRQPSAQIALYSARGRTLRARLLRRPRRCPCADLGRAVIDLVERHVVVLGVVVAVPELRATASCNSIVGASLVHDAVVRVAMLQADGGQRATGSAGLPRGAHNRQR